MGNPPAIVRDRKTEDGKIRLQSRSAVSNGSALKKKTTCSQSCGGHRGGVGRVKSGEG